MSGAFLYVLTFPALNQNGLESKEAG